MPTDFYASPDTGDITLDDSYDIRMTSSEPEFLGQLIANRLQTYLGESFTHPEYGIPYFTEALIKNPNIGTVKALMYDAVMAVEGVASIVSFDLSFDRTSRKLKGTLSVLSTSNETVQVNIRR